MKTKAVAILGLLLAASSVGAQEKAYPLAKVSYEDFMTLVAEVEPHRQQRLIDLDTFLSMSRQPGVVVLDTRSALRYQRIHLKGARHLSFPDFTQENLRTLIPSLDTTVLIYCNNNFEGNRVDFAPKVAMPSQRLGLKGKVAAREPSGNPGTQVAAEEKPVMLALNVPTYITLYGYGYRNVYELNELVNVTDPRVTFEGSVVETEQSPVVAQQRTKETQASSKRRAGP